ncbi:MAG: pantothenate synthetase [Bacteroidetes bacterium]|nr:pantothenate synthetase [Bacteroidota bacterium]
MKIIKTIREIEIVVKELKSEKKTIGFVPTMGALHAGHLSLIKRAADENDCCIISIFVNPTQFNNKTIYSDNELISTFDFDFGGMDKLMEGKFRPGHFNGVVQIVSKLFRLVKPDKAYFGKKDFQQLAIIHRMVKQMKFDVRIVDCPIVREKSGLAMSSRNERLTAEQRKTAVNIYRILDESRKLVAEKTPVELTKWVIDTINSVQGLEVEYFDIADTKTLITINKWQPESIGCIAVFCGEVRLIDNIEYETFDETSPRPSQKERENAFGLKSCII